MNRPITRRGALVGAVATATALSIAKSSHADAASAVHEVRIKNFKFDPDQLEVKIGDTIRWINDDLAPHTATAVEFGWDTNEIVKGESYELLVEAEMETEYFCAFHPHMTGSFKVS